MISFDWRVSLSERGVARRESVRTAQTRNRQEGRIVTTTLYLILQNWLKVTILIYRLSDRWQEMLEG